MSEAYPMYDKESEAYQMAVDRVDRMLDTKDWDMGQLRDALFNLPMDMRNRIQDAIAKRDEAEVGKLIIWCLYDHLLEMEVR